MANRPVLLNDPSGRCSICLAVAVVVVLAFVLKSDSNLEVAPPPKKVATNSTPAYPVRIPQPSLITPTPSSTGVAQQNPSSSLPQVADVPTPATTGTTQPTYTPPQKDVDWPSGEDVVNILFDPGPAGDPSFGSVIGSAIDSVPAVQVRAPNGMPIAVSNPLFGSGQVIGDTIDAVGLGLYLLVNHGELPSWGSAPPITSTPNLYTPLPIAPPTPVTTRTPSPP